MNASALEIDGLSIRFGSRHVVRGINLAVKQGETHCLVGESGCGKSVTALSVLGLLPCGATRIGGQIRFMSTDLAALSERALERLRGDRIAMIFQEPMTSLNPAYTVGSQMIEVLRRHRGQSRTEAVTAAAAMLKRVGIAAPEMRLRQFPHQLSGGLRQRVMIAMALLCSPAMLIADEPTTALDVTVQAQILRLLDDLKREFGLAVLLITHDLGVVARVADQVSVMYAGEIVEQAPVVQLFAAPSHPYTRGLLASIPVPGQVRKGEMLGSIPGVVPQIDLGFRGCSFRDRCGWATGACAAAIPMQAPSADHHVRCCLDPGWSS